MKRGVNQLLKAKHKTKEEVVAGPSSYFCTKYSPHKLKCLPEKTALESLVRYTQRPFKPTDHHKQDR